MSFPKLDLGINFELWDSSTVPKHLKLSGQGPIQDMRKIIPIIHDQSKGGGSYETS